VRITVFLGGVSSERDVSLASGIRITEALRQCGHAVVAVDPATGPLERSDEAALLERTVVKTAPPSQSELRRMAREALPRLVSSIPAPAETDVAFLALHGGYGEDGTIQALLDLVGIPYTGSGVLGSALAMDKDLSKRLFRDAGVTTPDWSLLREDDGRGSTSQAEVAERAMSEFGLPLVVKPSKQGSTVGLSVVKDPASMPAAISHAFEFDDEVIVERFIAGRELTVGILGTVPLPVGEIIPMHEIYDYECKYTPGMVVEEFPARIDGETALRAQELASRGFEALKLRGCARLDFRMSDDGELFCLEANTLPGMTQTSLVPQGAAAAGISFPALCDQIVQLALARGGTT